MRSGLISERLQGQGIPDFALALLDALQFRSSDATRLSSLTNREWVTLLDWCDRKQLTILLAERFGSFAPEQIRERLASTQEAFQTRHKRIQNELRHVTEILHSAGIPYAVLKGFTHSPLLAPDPVWRAQGDLDLWCPGVLAEQAHRLLTSAGYVAGERARSRHLSALTRSPLRDWNGILADLPIWIELHHELWSDENEFIPIPDQQGIWDRRCVRVFDEDPLPVLQDHDLVAFAVLHLFLHLIHGDLPLQRAWEIANFLESSRDDAAFWETWRSAHSAELRELQTIVFLLVQRWFACALPAQVQVAAGALNRYLRLWLERYGLALLAQPFRPHKLDLWLHVESVPSLAGKVRIIWRRLFPVAIPRNTGSDGRPKAGRLFLSRAAHHLATFGPATLEGLRWQYLKWKLARSEAGGR